ncbi:MAG TPA: ChbG/HpnK family deacetylase, partial [Polyangiaceae bacterium]
MKAAPRAFAKDDQGKRLVVRADDFGMCHAINRGITQAFRQGIVTTSSVMVPCPWFPEAVRLALELEIPVGIHSTLTCEWPNFRWGPLTEGASLTESDGTLWRTVQSAESQLVVEDATRELFAQARRAENAGLTPTYFDVHMGMTCQAAYDEVCRKYGFELVDFRLVAQLSDRPANQKVDWLISFIQSLEPGMNLLVSHPSVPAEEVRSMAEP